MKRDRHLLEDKQHLVRMAGIFAAGVLLFLVLQAVFVPKTFGRYGHYRAAAIDDQMKKPRAFGGRASCAGCHAAVVQVQQSGKHAPLGCEACHGAQAKHAADPAHVKPVHINAKALCPYCHEINKARPKWLKQVNTAEHSNGEACDTCHQPHSPQM